jgi:hypothetical protein
MNHKRLLIVIPIIFLALFWLLVVFFKNKQNLDSMNKNLNGNKLIKISYKEALDILDKIKNQKEIPDSQINNAVIIIRDDSRITAEIKCESMPSLIP